MKTILFLLLAFTYFISLGQNFRTVSSKREVIFKNSKFSPAPFNSGNYFPINIDSIKIEGIDTAYYNFNILTNIYLDNKPKCNQPIVPNWIGEKVLVRPNGDNLFFNVYKDTILIKSTARVNDNWKLYRFSNGDYFEATLTNKTLGQVLGINDSIKAITLNLKDNQNNSLPHLFNGKSILLSKDFGIIQAPAFLLFPNDTSMFHSAGISDIKMGVQEITAKDVFNYNIGDEFHLQYNQVEIPKFRINNKEKRIVLTKFTSSNKDTLTYTYKRKLYNYKNDYTKHTTDSSMTYDTISEKIILSEYPEINQVSRKIGFANFVKYNIIKESDYNNRLGKTIKLANLNITDSCIFDIIGTMYDDYYVDGLGYFYEGGDFYSGASLSLIYYQKGSETWGTPDPMLTSLNSKYNNVVSIQPNPFQSDITFKLGTNRSYELEIIDSFGKKVKNISFFGSEITIPSEGWKGIFFYRISSDGELSDTGKIIGY